MRITCSLIALSLWACGGPTASETPEPPAPANNEGKPFLPTNRTVEAMQRSTDDRETMRLVGEAGEFSLTLEVDGQPLTATMGIEATAFNIGDVPTLSFPKGYVRLDPLSLAVSGSDQDKAIIDAMFRRQGSPIQIFFEVQSVGEMQGRLAGAGSSARGQVIGTLQVHDRKADLEVAAVFERSDEGRLAVAVQPFELPLADIAYTELMPSLLPILGARSVGAVVRIEGGFELVEFTGERLPDFVRTPLTVNTVDEIVEKLDAEIDDYDAEIVRLRAQGVPEALLEKMDRVTFERQNKALESIKKMQEEARRQAAAKADAERERR